VIEVISVNDKLYSKTEFDAIKDKLNAEIKRRGTFKWWDPLTTPAVGADRTSEVTDKTYTINTPSTGSIEPTRNIKYPAQGDNPVGDINSSSARIDVDEIQNYLVGLSKIHDIDLFYGRDEVAGLVFRDPEDISTKIEAAENDILNVPVTESFQKYDPNNGVTNGMYTGYGLYPIANNGKTVTVPVEYPSGEYDGEEILPGHSGPDETNFYDDYGASPGVIDHHPINPYVSPIVHRHIITQDDQRNETVVDQVTGGISSASRFGANPRNPNRGSEYPSRQISTGSKGLCNVACTGLCYLTCDNQCSEGCASTCWSRCGNACHSDCGNICTGCTTQCYSGCKTKCSDIGGKSCLNAGADTVSIKSTGNPSGCSNNCGQTASSAVIQNTVISSTYTCSGCSFSCQYYPNKKTTCWDSVCSALCFTTCNTYCSTSCFGGCISNDNEHNGGYKSGKGQSCKEGCVADCTGDCAGVCEGVCTLSCFSTCKNSCYDNCTVTCSNNCGNCDTGCSNGCTACDGCTGSCNLTCTGTCFGCTSACTATCKIDCNANTGIRV
jgi:hypothetical protein